MQRAKTQLDQYTDLTEEQSTQIEQIVPTDSFRIFDGDQLSDLMAPLGLGWKDRTRKELELVRDLAPLLRKLTKGQDISGLSAYEQ